MSARTKARKRALDLLYQADLRGIALSEVIAEEAKRAASQPAREGSWLYAREIVDGVGDHAAEIDDAIEDSARGWSLARMPAVDRAILRMASWEILFNDEVPAGVAIAEAVALAGELSTEESSAFVNGVLGAVAAL